MIALGLNKQNILFIVLVLSLTLSVIEYSILIILWLP